MWRKIYQILKLDENDIETKILCKNWWLIVLHSIIAHYIFSSKQQQFGIWCGEATFELKEEFLLNFTFSIHKIYVTLHKLKEPTFLKKAFSTWTSFLSESILIQSTHKIVVTLEFKKKCWSDKKLMKSCKTKKKISKIIKQSWCLLFFKIKVHCWQRLGLKRKGILRHITKYHEIRLCLFYPLWMVRGNAWINVISMACQLKLFNSCYIPRFFYFGPLLM